MLTRRQLIIRGAAGGAGLVMSPALLQQAALGARMGPLKSYQADLLDYIPPIVPVADGATVELAVNEVERVVHPAAAPTTVWSYELATGDPRVSGKPGSWIGPILALSAGSAITVKYAMSSEIRKHLLEASIDRAMLDPYVNHGGAGSDTRFMTHLHGAFVDGGNDGNPFATDHTGEWAPGDVETKQYAAQDRAALLWYHQHAHGITHVNVYAGLAGGYLLRDGLDTGRQDNELGLPANVDKDGNAIGVYEVPLVIQDRIFRPNARGARLDLFYPPAPWAPEFFGDEMCVNGAVEPFLEIEPRLYRFRIINGCNARFLNLDFLGGSLSGLRPPMHVIGSDGGFLPAPWTTKSIVMAPGERYDIVVDFSAMQPGDIVNLNNKALPAPVVNPAGPLPRMMQFRVTKPLVKANQPAATFKPAAALTTDTPAVLNGMPGAGFVDPDRTRYHTFEEVMGMAGPLGAVINGMSFEGRKIKVDKTGTGVMQGYPFWLPTDPDLPDGTKNPGPVGVTETPRNGTTEDWWFANTTADTHPLHMHLVQFQTCERRRFDVVEYLADLANARAVAAGQPLPNPGRPAPPPLAGNNTINPTGYMLPGGTAVSPAETGWKDTVQMHPGEVTRIRARFEVKHYGAPQDYVYHCHILEHESNSMMRPYRVVG